MLGNKEKFGVIFILLLVLALVGFVFRQRIAKQEPKSIQQQEQAKTIDASHQISGQILKVEGNVITLQGIVKSSVEGSEKLEKKTIAITVPDNVVLDKTVGYKDMETYKPGQTFALKTKPGVGTLSDLKQDLFVIRLVTKEDIFTTDKATAESIHYMTYDFNY